LLYMACIHRWISADWQPSAPRNWITASCSCLHGCGIWYSIFSRLPHITPLHSCINACNATDALSYTSNGIMGLHNTILMTGMLQVGFYWTTLIQFMSYSFLFLSLSFLLLLLFFLLRKWFSTSKMNLLQKCTHYTETSKWPNSELIISIL
jgi:hypothetical protein